MPKVPYPYEVNGKLVTGNGSLIPICSLSSRSLLPSLTVLYNEKPYFTYLFNEHKTKVQCFVPSIGPHNFEEFRYQGIF